MIRHLYTTQQVQVHVLIYNNRVEIFVFGSLDEVKYLNGVFDYSHDVEARIVRIKHNKIIDSLGGQSYLLYKKEGVDRVIDRRYERY